MKKVISLGYNCEVTFQIERFFGKANTSLFSWSYVLDDEKFLRALGNIDDVFTHDFHFHLPSDDMFYDETYALTFHGRTHKSKMLDENGVIIDEQVYRDCVEELKSRIHHLKEKVKDDFTSKVTKYYIRKLRINTSVDGTADIDTAISFINKLDNVLSTNVRDKKYKLYIVMEEKYMDVRLNQLESETVCIRYLKYFAPDNDTKFGADNDSWDAIMKEIIEQEDAEMMDDLSSLKAWTDELYNAKVWMEEQIKYLSSDLENEKKWNADLLEGKQWLEGQNENLIKENEELRGWIKQLEERDENRAKENEELRGWIKQLEERDANRVKENEELRLWIRELEDARDYLKRQLEGEDGDSDSKMTSNQMLEYENTIARQKYMLKSLLQDPGVQKAVKRAKIPVSLEMIY